MITAFRLTDLVCSTDCSPSGVGCLYPQAEEGSEAALVKALPLLVGLAPALVAGGDGGVLKTDIGGWTGAGATRTTSLSLSLMVSCRDKSKKEEEGEVAGDVDVVRFDFELELEREWL